MMGFLPLDCPMTLVSLAVAISADCTCEVMLMLLRRHLLFCTDQPWLDLACLFFLGLLQAPIWLCVLSACKQATTGLSTRFCLFGGFIVKPRALDFKNLTASWQTGSILWPSTARYF